MVRVPRVTATSCTAATSLASAPVSPFLTFSPQYSLIALGSRPGLRMATTHRLSFHCAPSSLTVVDITASALVWRYSLRVISATRVKLLTSASSVAGAWPVPDEAGAGLFLGALAAGAGGSGAEPA